MAAAILPFPHLASSHRRCATLARSYSNPNNPTGSVMDAAAQRAILDIARAAGAYVIADEVGW